MRQDQEHPNVCSFSMLFPFAIQVLAEAFSKLPAIFQKSEMIFPWFSVIFFDFSSSQLATDHSANGSWVDDSCWWWVNLQGHRHGKLEFLLQLPSSQLGSRYCLVPTSLLPTTSGQVTEDQLPPPNKKKVKNSGFFKGNHLSVACKTWMWMTIA